MSFSLKKESIKARALKLFLFLIDICNTNPEKVICKTQCLKHWRIPLEKSHLEHLEGVDLNFYSRKPEKN